MKLSAWAFVFLSLPALADEEGKRLFTVGAVPSCTVCHALKDAGATGAIGPSLDELKPDAARVAKAVKNGIGQMPAFTQLTEEQVQAIARYVEKASR
ncbi:SorU family sulfite dehydrogenase c-type cytochrome subunit [Ramlibacter sp. PS4R-6]|uniref:SorU family sulfite dehydrogenase c-type cytochrome subunit n=1 Tax=Ramlibacter sp. PS4R-6 TaxID=3133438 RepID=UPI0030B2B029